MNTVCKPYYILEDFYIFTVRLVMNTVYTPCYILEDFIYSQLG